MIAEIVALYPKEPALYPKEPAPPKCSFCGKPQTQSKKMMSNGNDKFICNVCIKKASELL